MSMNKRRFNRAAAQRKRMNLDIPLIGPGHPIAKPVAKPPTPPKPLSGKRTTLGELLGLAADRMATDRKERREFGL